MSEPTSVLKIGEPYQGWTCRGLLLAFYDCCKESYGHTSTPQLPLKIPHIPTNRDQKALNRGTLGGLGTRFGPVVFDHCDL